MNRLVLALPLLALTAMMDCSAIANESTVTISIQTFSQTALLGMQLATQDRAKDGKISNAVANCVSALKPDSFYSVFEQVLTSEFSTSERNAIDMFLSSVVGEKCAKHGLLQIYTSTGHQLPEPLPKFSSDEMNELVNFGKTTAGQKLLVNKVLQSSSAAGLFNTRINALLVACNEGT
ncbi:hypothetical protein HQ393_00720 [Chitinibacter bivalviorum]|uniref:DUF2059 domain-containing protein n=1 Tax=Chitinibacter bivalviorum TaxID=2739434 RepID=A0A7H9BFB3_9NEIS|nr:hypothetical protein [Chitinibacter bivalviorum]QLG86878.1 hypothetical protein HQ393_00720 [Chitinibacter bivalviorum]